MVEIISDPGICFGEPVIEGTRVRITDVIDYYRAGESIETISEELQVDVEAVREIVDYSERGK